MQYGANRQHDGAPERAMVVSQVVGRLDQTAPVPVASPLRETSRSALPAGRSLVRWGATDRATGGSGVAAGRAVFLRCLAFHSGLLPLDRQIERAAAHRTLEVGFLRFTGADVRPASPPTAVPPPGCPPRAGRHRSGALPGRPAHLPAALRPANRTPPPSSPLGPRSC